MIHAIQELERSGQHARRLGVRRWQSSAPFPTAALLPRRRPHSVRPSV